jgi:hypothetical protein
LIKLKETTVSKKLSYTNPNDDELMKEKSADDLWWASLCIYALLSEDTLVMRFARKQSKIAVNRYVIQRLPNLKMSEHASNFILFCLTVS